MFIFFFQVWMMILNKIEDTDDVMSCYYTCDTFRNLMETRMISQVQCKT